MNTRVPRLASPDKGSTFTVTDAQQAPDSIKTYMQQRDANLVKPREQKHSMWDMLALKQAIENKKEDYVKKQA